MEWLTKYWKTIAAVTYIAICIMDFLAIPIIISIKDINYFENFQNIIDMVGVDNAMELAKTYKPKEWIPFTLKGAGLFHISFGAILTGTVLNKK